MPTGPMVAESRFRRGETRAWLKILSIHNLMFASLNRALSTTLGLSLAKFDVLAQLDQHPDGISLGFLSERLQVTGGNVSGLVQRLLADDLIIKQMSDTDRRSFLVRLSPKGESVFREACEIHRKKLEQLFAKVADDELDGALGMLTSLSRHVSEGRDD